MKIAEIFYSVQGEGSLLGMPSVFVRTSGCNLRCVWCDTPYTSWHPEGEQLELDEILDRVSAFPARHVVLTGGEPMIAPRIADLTDALHGRGHHITIETAGTVHHELQCDLMSISPKLRNSVPEGPFAASHERLRMQPGILQRLMQDYDYQLKFVVMTPQDLTEIDQLVGFLGAPPDRVILMPEGTHADVVRERGLWLAEICKKTGYRYSPRLHVDLWGNRRGV